jgi:K+-sensing histidine kinase KdpD
MTLPEPKLRPKGECAMDWSHWICHGPVGEIFGIPAFWIARIAKITQLVSGMVIVLDIIGQDRVEEWANSMREQLANLAAAQPFRDAAAELWNTVISFLKYLSARPSTEQEDEKLRVLVDSKYNRVARYIWLITTMILFTGAVVFSVRNHGWSWNILLYFIPVLLASALISLVFTYLALFNLLLIFFIAIVRPTEWVFDIFASGVVSVLKRRGLSQVALILSFALLVLGMLSELLAS